MNEKFFSLPKEKQQAILNAGYRVFSQMKSQAEDMAGAFASMGPLPPLSAWIG